MQLLVQSAKTIYLKVKQDIVDFLKTLDTLET